MPNRLFKETSPYLVQHADNPVDWHPWSEKALTLAREQDKPILLSIGYSACHWCHVMAHESFENAATAALMNEQFVNIKVDREERPDLDQIYQTAHGMLTGRNGGWPLTMFLTPEQMPFFGGTYFPDTPRYGMPAFRDLLSNVAQHYREKKDELAQQNEQLLDDLRLTLPQGGQGEALDEAPIVAGLQQLQSIFDLEHGGFDQAPKFPNPADIELCLREGAGGNAKALDMALKTLRGMALGGIYDQLGGGFCRYSVDDHWEIPHFEKMLYDNGQLLCLYADAWRVTGEPLFTRVVEETVAWALREMHAPDGTFYSSLDADSEGAEGKFHVWQSDEIRSLLTEQEYALIEPYYGLDGAPNFEHGAWHLHVACDLETAAQKSAVSLETALQLLASARRKLFAARELRVRPGRDEKILTSWNALMVKGLARAGRAFRNTEWITAAQNAVDVIRSRYWIDGRLLATGKDGDVRLNAYLDDYAFLLDAQLELLQAEYRAVDWEFALALAETLLERFQDNAVGGFYFTSHDHETLIYRPKIGYDNATPSGNGMAAYGMQRLGHLAGRNDFLQAARRTLMGFEDLLQKSPAGCPSMLMALREFLTPPTLVVLRGEDDELASWRGELEWHYRPHALLLFLANDIGALSPALDRPVQDHVNAWVCHGVNCLPAVDTLNELFAVI